MISLALRSADKVAAEQDQAAGICVWAAPSRLLTMPGQIALPIADFSAGTLPAATVAGAVGQRLTFALVAAAKIEAWIAAVPVH